MSRTEDAQRADQAVAERQGRTPCEWCRDSGWRASKPYAWYDAHPEHAVGTTMFPCDCPSGQASVPINEFWAEEDTRAPEQRGDTDEVIEALVEAFWSWHRSVSDQRELRDVFAAALAATHLAVVDTRTHLVVERDGLRKRLIEHFNDDVGVPLWIQDDYRDPVDELIAGFADSAIRFIAAVGEATDAGH